MYVHAEEFKDVNRGNPHRVQQLPSHWTTKHQRGGIPTTLQSEISPGSSGRKWRSFLAVLAKKYKLHLQTLDNQAISIRVRHIVARANWYFCNTCKRNMQHPSRNQTETGISVGLTVLGARNGTVAHRRLRQCGNCNTEEFTTLELKEQDFNELLEQIESSKAEAAAARQELASLKRAVLNAVELSTESTATRLQTHRTPLMRVDNHSGQRV